MIVKHCAKIVPKLSGAWISTKFSGSIAYIELGRSINQLNFVADGRDGEVPRGKITHTLF